MERTILHCDLNNFYASVACAERPALKTRPVAVCGSQDNRQGIVLAKNEPAKRFGIATGDVIWQARQKCPGLVVLPPDFPKYALLSRKIRAVYQQYTDLVEPFGIDECWLDVTGSTSLFGSGERIACEVKDRIRQEFGITASVGVSFNKIFAKLGSDLKKPDAVTVIGPGTFRQQIWELPAGDLLGVGRATLRRLSASGIFTIGDIAQADPRFLKRLLGKNGLTLHQYANGRDLSPVRYMDRRPPVKSIGHSATCKSDLQTDEEVWKALLQLADDVCARLRAAGFRAGGVCLYLRDSALAAREFQSALRVPTSLGTELADSAFALFRAHWRWPLPIRALGVRAVSLLPAEAGAQTSLFDDAARRAKREALARSADGLRARFGADTVRRAVLLTEDKLPPAIPEKDCVLPNAFF